MEELFGLPTIRLMWIVVAIAGVAAAVIVYIFLKRPILVRMGLRNIPRRRAQTVLVTMGLTLATIIVTIAFSTGDSLAVSVRNLALNGLERIDHFIIEEETDDSAEDAGTGIPDQVLSDLQSHFADDDRVEAIFGSRFDLVPIEHPEAGQIEPQFFLVGVDPQTVDRLDAVRDRDGDLLRLSELGTDEIVINERAARELDAEPGDQVKLYVLGRARQYTVAAIGRDAVLTGNLEAGGSGGLLSIDAYQNLLGPQLSPPDRWDSILISGAGGVEAPLEFSDALDRDIEAALDGFERQQPDLYLSNGLSRYASDAVKADSLEDAELIASVFTTLFLFMGSFSVAAGILLIFLIFAMLAEERKPEMGIARAVGMQRNDLIQMFISEGMVYNMGAAVVGVVLGLLFALGFIAALNQGFESFGFVFTWTVTIKSLVISACIGIVITFITVVFSSFRASRLNIVAAIRDIPEARYEETYPLTPWRVVRNVLGVFTTAIGLVLLLTTPFTLILGAPIALVLHLIGSRWSQRMIPWVLLFGWRLMRWNPQWWVLFVIGGLVVLDFGLDQESFFPYMTGVSLIPLGIVMGLNKLRLGSLRINQRLLYTLGAGFVMFLWFIPNDWHESFFDNNLNGGPELFVLAGTMLTAAGTLLLVFNLDLIVGGVRRIVGGIGRMAPVIRTAAAYPAAARYRTGMTIAMIALITFALVNFTTINSSFSQAFTGDDTAGGFEVLAFNTDVNAVSDIREGLADAGADEVIEDIENAGRIEAGPERGTRAITILTERWDAVTERHILDRDGDIQLVETDLAEVEIDDRDAVVIGGINDEFVDGQEVKLQAISYRYEDERDVWSALRSGDMVAVATVDAIDGAFGFAGNDLDPWSVPDTVTDEATLLPRIVVEVGLGENARQVEVIAILERISGAFVDLDGEDGGLPTLLLPETVASQVIGQSESTRHYISTRDGADTLDVAQGIERELRIFAVDIQGELQRQQSTQSSILALFQGFIGIGLVAGLAALGVIALRAVVERRQQIGVLRAIGFQSRLVGFELLIEMGFIALLGLGLGTGLALGLAWRLFAEGTFGEISMHVPVGTILPILIGAFLASLVLTYFPARQAARTTIAEALRYE
ncbi:MAG: FtsX-like permease family protein [Chloroflexi bacterium]|nr:FtsX-like permease family protein [Chloroflexota bacterium]MCY3588553.1 FtsX-like permease family protein [Chloroflexota bacterium]MCY3685597.1 FtsX-like permease family protein [Chloroflexota bacterium]MDE2708499.1 FtsX-like permease family protein [Chloroflexota bacterium]